MQGNGSGPAWLSGTILQLEFGWTDKQYNTEMTQEGIARMHFVRDKQEKVREQKRRREDMKNKAKGSMGGRGRTRIRR